MKIKDAEIISLMQNPRTQDKGVRALMDAYQSRLYWHIRRIIVDGDLAQDTLQETFIKAYQNFHQFKNDSQLYTWLYRIALNTALIFLKSEKRRSFIGNGDFSGYALAQEDYDDQKEERLTEMYQAIHQLNPIDKAFIFYYLEDFSGKQIADEMGISEGNARVKMNRAKNKLKDILSQHKK